MTETHTATVILDANINRVGTDNVTLNADISRVSITCDGEEISGYIVYSSAQFTAQVNGAPGQCAFRVIDRKDGRWQPKHFRMGQQIVLSIDNVRVWGGFITNVRYVYPASVVDTTEVENTVTFWDIEGTDWNILFTRRYVYNQSKPTRRLRNWVAGTSDKVVIDYMIANWLDLSGDNIDTSGVTAVGTPGQFEKFRVAAAGQTWGDAMDSLCRNIGSVFYIDPDRKLHYVDDDVVTAAYGLSDKPTASQIGYAECEITSTAADMANDVLIWGAGQGSAKMVFARATSASSVNEHGVFQYGELRGDQWKQLSVERRANTYLNGSPQNRRGHKNDHVFITCTVYDAPFRVGQVVAFESQVHGITYVGPIREMTVSFPVPDVPRMDLKISKEIDPGLAFADPYRYKIPRVGINKPSPGGDLDGDLEVIKESADPKEEVVIIPLESLVFSSAIWTTLVKDSDSEQITQAGPFDLNKPGTWVTTNTPWPLAACFRASGLPIGYGAWGPQTTWRETWYQLPASVNRTDAGDERSIILSMPELQVSGYVRGFTIGIAHLEPGDNPAPASFRTSTGVATWGPVDLYPDGVNATRTVPATEIIIPYVFREAQSNWLVISPLRTLTVAGTILPITDIWEAKPEKFCDIDYSQPGHPYAGRGPYITGQADSGQAILPLVLPLRLAVVEDMTEAQMQPFSSTDQYPEFYDLDGSLWSTEYPFIPGSLRVYVDGTLLRTNIEVFEIDAASGMFRLSIPGDLRITGNIRIKYERGNDYPVLVDRNLNQIHTGVNNDGLGALKEPETYTAGRVYRPKYVTQFGHGTQYDGMNAQCAAASMVVARTTSGLTRLSPPVLRGYANVSRNMVTLGDLYAGLLEESIDDVYYGSGLSIQRIEDYVNEGRGIAVSGDYQKIMTYRYNAGFDLVGWVAATGSALYINEQRADGMFLVYDPSIRDGSKTMLRVGWYPRAVIKSYIDSGNDALWTRRTPIS